MFLPADPAAFSRRPAARDRGGLPVAAEVLEPRALLSAAATPDDGRGDHDHGGHCTCGHCGGGGDANAPHLHVAPLPDRTLGPGGGTGHYRGSGALRPLAETFELQSNPGADHTIFLDFDGHVTRGTYWQDAVGGGGDRVVTAAFNATGGSGFADSELATIQGVWQRVAEDFLPFDVNVTTRDPGAAALARDGAGDERWGVRVAVGGSWEDWFGSSAGGVAYVGSFRWDGRYGADTPTFVFSDDLGDDEKYVAEAVSHEIGHTLGLHHDGTQSRGYYTGHGSGATGWAPILGVGYYRELTQWSRGEYAGANQTQDDLAVITADNGFGYRADDYGGTFAAAADLTFAGGAGAFADSGIVGRNTDADAFRFSTAGGAVSVRADVAGRGANLDVRLELRDAAGRLVAAADPSGQLWAELSADVAAGDYWLRVSGAGDGDPAGGGYSDYGSLGAYRLGGTVAGGSAVGGDGEPADENRGDRGAGDTDSRRGDRDSRGGRGTGGEAGRERDAGVVVRGPRLLRVSERGSWRRFRVRLADRPEARVAIRVKVSDGTEGRVNVRKLVFTPQNWRRNQSVTLIGKDDRGRDGNKFFEVELKAARSRDAAYAGLDADDVWARNRDDDRRRGRRARVGAGSAGRSAAPPAVRAAAPRPAAARGSAGPAREPVTPRRAAVAGPEKTVDADLGRPPAPKPAWAPLDAAFLPDAAGLTAAETAFGPWF